MPKQLEPVSLNVDMPTIMAYADLTDDYNPIHVDREFAEKTRNEGHHRPWDDVAEHDLAISACCDERR